MNEQAEKIALVTGGNRGIGREITRQLALRGWRVFIGARDAAAAERAVVELQALSRQVIFLPLDVSDSASIRAAAGECRPRLLPGREHNKSRSADAL